MPDHWVQHVRTGAAGVGYGAVACPERCLASARHSHRVTLTPADLERLAR